MKTLSACAFCIVACLNALSQSKKIESTINKIFLELNNQTPYVFIADTTLEAFPFSFNQLKDHVHKNDRALMKQIVARGRSNPISGKEVEKMIKLENRTKTKSEFFSFQTPSILLTEQEEK